MKASENQHEAMFSNVGESASANFQSELESERPNQATSEDDSNTSSPEYVALDRTTIDSCGRRSMAYLQQATGKIVAESEIRDAAAIPDQVLRDAGRRDDIFRCWALCENVRPQSLRKAVRYLVQPLYWLAIISSVLITLWESYWQHKRQRIEEDKAGKRKENPSKSAQAEELDALSTDDDFSDLLPLEKTARDSYGRRSMAFINRKTGAVITSTEVTEHGVPDGPVRRFHRRCDVALCLLLCENIRPESLRTVLRAASLPFFYCFLAINSFWLRKDIEREMKQA